MDTATLTPGQVVIEELGPLSAVADGLRDEFPRIARSTVWRWSQPRDEGGTDGRVPSRYHRPLLRLAQRLGKRLDANDLVYGRAPDDDSHVR